MKVETTYYAGVYNNNVRGVSRVLNISDCIDGISCEILADPGVVSRSFSGIYVPVVREMIMWAQVKAKKWNCSHIEVNCARGQGSYQWHKVK